MAEYIKLLSLQACNVLHMYLYNIAYYDAHVLQSEGIELRCRTVESAILVYALASYSVSM